MGLHERLHPKLIGPVDELETMSKQQGRKEVLELEMFTNKDPSTSYHIFQKLGTPWPYFVSLQGDNCHGTTSFPLLCLPLPTSIHLRLPPSMSTHLC